MEKIYFDQKFNSFFVKEVSEIYSIKCVDTNTNKEERSILTWTKDSLREEEIKDKRGFSDVRLYVTEIRNRKFHFVLRYDSEFGKFFISSENDYELDFFKKETGCEFVGELENLKNLKTEENDRPENTEI